MFAGSDKTVRARLRTKADRKWSLWLQVPSFNLDTNKNKSKRLPLQKEDRYEENFSAIHL